MKITQVIWLKQFSDKIESKHAVSRDEVEELFRSQPRYKLMEKGLISWRKCVQSLWPKQRRPLPSRVLHLQRSGPSISYLR